MFRLFIIALLFWLIIWVVRGYGGRGRDESAAEELVRDALTGIYFPKKDSVTITRGGETFYFMNIENRDRYLTMNR